MSEAKEYIVTSYFAVKSRIDLKVNILLHAMADEADEITTEQKRLGNGPNYITLQKPCCSVEGIQYCNVKYLSHFYL